MKIFSLIYKFLNIFALIILYCFKASARNEKIEILKIEWAKIFFQRLNAEIVVIGSPVRQGPVLFVGNHISYIDIPLLMACAPSVSFIAKKQVSNWPLIGRAAKIIGTIFVDRLNAENKNLVKQQMEEALLGGSRLVIFPSGTTQLNEIKRWKKGAFEVAQNAKVNIQPFKIVYKPLRPLAYIDQDNFIIHLFQLLKLKKIQIEIYFHEPVQVLNPIADCEYWQNWALHSFEVSSRELVVHEQKQM